MVWRLRNWPSIVIGLAVLGLAGGVDAAGPTVMRAMRAPSLTPMSASSSCGTSACGGGCGTSACSGGGDNCGTSACGGGGSTSGGGDNCNCEGGVGGGESHHRHHGGGGGGGRGGNGQGGGGGSGQGGGGGNGQGGTGQGGNGGSGGSVVGDFSGSTSVTVTGTLVNQLGGNGPFAVSGSSNAFGLGGATNGSSNNNGGGGSSYYVDFNSSYIPSLNVEEAAAAATASVNVPYQATRQVTKIVAVQAVCLDDKSIPHPASQVGPERNIQEGFEGEIYRCIAGARMQFTIADYNGQVSFDQGQTVTCDKHSALYHVAGGRIECRPEKPARDCNERSLLRRFGAGIKILKIIWTETYTAYRTETQTATATASASASAMGMAIDGGVGGVVH